MKRLLVAFIAITLLASPLNALAAVKAGDPCKRLGSTSTAGGKKFTCVKSGKKLVWNKGVAVVKPTPTPTPTPTPSTPQPIIEKVPSGFEDLVENYRGVYVGVWNSSNSKIEANAPVDVNQNILVGPNTKLPSEDVSIMFFRGTRFFAGYTQPKRFNAIYYTFEDIKWAEDTVFSLYKNSEDVKQISRNCQSIQRCNGANAGMAQSDIGHGNFAVDKGATDPYHLKGGLEIHEYAHMVQFIQFQGKPTQRMAGGAGLIPNWFLEGHAHLAGNVGSARTLADYKIFRSFWLNARPDGLPGYSPENIENFYEKLSPGKFDPTVQSNVYSIGFFTVEALASIKGVDSPIEVIKQISDGATWEEAFLKVYGISWKDAAPILAKTVSRMFLERY